MSVHMKKLNKVESKTALLKTLNEQTALLVAPYLHRD